MFVYLLLRSGSRRSQTQLLSKPINPGLLCTTEEAAVGALAFLGQN